MHRLYGRRSVLSAMVAASVVNASAGGRSQKESRSDRDIFINSLLSAGPHASLGHHAETYGRLIGNWTGRYQDMDVGASVDTGTIEVHFAWVLEGRAVQDTWIAPGRGGRREVVGKRQTCGVTLRVFDPTIEAWRCTWFNPRTAGRKDLIGRRVGEEIVQYCIGQERPEQWVFSEIQSNSFLWKGSVLADDGRTWNVGTEFRLVRSTV